MELVKFKQKDWEFRADLDATPGHVVIELLRAGEVVGVRAVRTTQRLSTYAAEVEHAKDWLRKVCGAPADTE